MTKPRRLHSAEDEKSLEDTTGTAASSYTYSCSSGSNRGREGPSTAVAESLRSGGGTAATPATYVNVAPLPIFRGGAGECPVAHMRRFLRVCRANNARSPETMARVFPVTLDGEAALWYELEVEPLAGMSWEEIEASFMTAFCRPETAEQSRSELMAMKQEDGETVNAYYLRMQWILRKWPAHGIPDGMLRGLFVDGLKEDYQDWIVPQRPQSLEEAFRLALSWEQAQRTREARRRRTAAAAPPTEKLKCGFCDGQHEEGSCEVRRGMRELWLRSRERTEKQRQLKQSMASGGNLRSLSLSASMTRPKQEWEERKEEEMGLLSFRRSQCQCWKHQCWKKYDRSSAGLPEGNPTPSAD